MDEGTYQPRQRRKPFPASDLQVAQPIPGYPEAGQVILGRTVPSLLVEAHQRNSSPKAFNRLSDGKWIGVSTEQFQQYSDQLALGLQDLNLARADRVCLFMNSDTYFCVADMACLTAGLVDVPIYLTHTQDSIEYVLKHAEARALIVSNGRYLEQLSSVIPELRRLESVVVALSGPEASGSGLQLRKLGIRVATMEELIRLGRERLKQDPEAADELRDQIHAHDLATIVYTSGTTGRPKGVMLTHENLTCNALTSFSALEGMDRGRHVALSFLPLTHAFARTLHYGFLNYGVRVFFVTPEEISHGFRTIRPTVFATVPRVLEKFHERILERGQQLQGARRKLFDWALGMARNYDLATGSAGWDRVKLKTADRLVFSKWRKALGGRVNFIICGGAPLRPDLVNLFAAARIQVLQGYGLTETSPIISCNRPRFNRAGTVGVPLPGIEVAIAPDGEILTRGPHVMRGYYRDPQGSRECIDTDNWLHTGDIGRFTELGLLQITDRKKDLFKLSTGKYVMPQPLEAGLISDPLVDQVLVVGAARKFCTALIFPSFGNLAGYAARLGIPAQLTPEEQLCHPKVQEHFQETVEQSNQGLPHWSTIKHFRVVPAELTVENGLLTPTLKVRRTLVRSKFAEIIDAMYEEAESGPEITE